MIKGPINHLLITQNNRSIIAGSWDQTVKSLELEIQHRTHFFEQAHTGKINQKIII